MSKPATAFLENAIYLVDASSYIFRAYYGIQNPLTAPDGTPTHATFAFIQMIESLISSQKIQKIALIWDRKEKGFRHDLFPEYKANRQIPPEDLSLQIERSQEMMIALGVPQFSQLGYEADDVIASLIAKHPEENFVIVTADKDLLQLVGPNVWCLDTMKRKWSNKEEAIEKFGVPPHKISTVQALCGDSVDNIPGAPGIGPKTASQLVETFGDLDSILEEAKKRHAHPEKYKKTTDALKGKKIENIALNIEKILLSEKLVKLSLDAPITINPDCFVRTPVDLPKLKSLAESLGFQKLIQKYSSDKSSTSERESQTLAKFHLIESITELERILENNQNKRSMTLDTETKSLECRKAGNIVGISFCFSEEESFYVPLDHTNGSNIDIRIALNLVFQFISDHSITNVIFQNAKFDLHVFEAEGFKLPSKIEIQDTMVASFVLDPSQSHGMDSLAQKYLDGYQTIKFKEVLGDLAHFGEISPKDAKDYAAEDAWVTLRLWNTLSELLHTQGLWDVYDRLDRPLISLLQKMETLGVAIDEVYLKELSARFHKDVLECKEEAFKILSEFGIDANPETLNLGSTKQVAKILFEDLKLPVIKEGKTGPSTDVSVLEELSLQHPFPTLLLEYRELTKLLSTYVDAFPELIDPQTHRLHTDFSQIIAQTGRLASSNPNLQNIPIRTPKGQLIRTAFKAREKHLLLGVDYSQIELRMLAHVTEAPKLIEAFEENVDIHRRTASLVLGKAEASITDEERRAAKTINFGIIYGQTAFGLSKTLKISKSDAQKFIDSYFKSYPQIQDYMDQSIEAARKTGVATTITGRKRPLKDINSKNATIRKFAERMAINSPLQGSAADLMKAAMISVEHAIDRENLKSKLLLQVHDELIFEVPEYESNTMKNLVISCLEDHTLLASFGIPRFKVTMKAVATLGPNWGEI